MSPVTPPEAQDTSNDFFLERVSIDDVDMLVPLRPIHHMTLGEGLRLAAWIVMLADPNQDEFPAVLAALVDS
jgi:hypothetical protein